MLGSAPPTRAVGTALLVGTLAPLGETGPERPGTIVRVTW